MKHITTSYHGTCLSRAEKILDESVFRVSVGGWLGSGTYFFPQSLLRAWAWANFIAAKASRNSGVNEEPVVLKVELTLDTDTCLDLSDWHHASSLKRAAEIILKSYQFHGKSVTQYPPLHYGSQQEYETQFIGAGINLEETFVLNPIDSDIVDYIVAQANHDRPIIKAIKGVFMHGFGPHATSHFFSQNHVQICVPNPYDEDLVSQPELVSRNEIFELRRNYGKF